MQQTKLPDFDINKQNLNVQTHLAAFALAGTTDIFLSNVPLKIDYVESEWQTAVTTRTFYSEVNVIYFVKVYCQHDSKRLKICV